MHSYIVGRVCALQSSSFLMRLLRSGSITIVNCLHKYMLWILVEVVLLQPVLLMATTESQAKELGTFFLKVFI